MLFLNGHSLDGCITHFPDGTSQIWNIPDHFFHPFLQVDNLSKQKVHLITWVYDKIPNNDFIIVAQIKALFNVAGERCDLYLPFLPYARQDKQISNKTCFGLHSFAYMLNSLGFHSVMVNDPHSTASSMITNLAPVYPISTITGIISKYNQDIVYYPDNGANQKYSVVYADKLGVPTISGDKVRDQTTGAITSLHLSGDCKDKSVLIVDDICDGGATFCMAAQELIKSGAKTVDLFVTHGVFSKGVKGMHDSGIRFIFSTNAITGEYNVY